ncbi:Aste57867_19886 [Aphanomyces stellatus]|uniref:Aste57867_19886 protein n=1 Tax=Aphanomyces stellatus TaxID=120398 RepID=A0A485LF65_9STRA|nr:hypothetical protein As57867_019820 [Aphanomyces stellatus]VFT96584.1 Aste57867_19886 [Aphanomyces stellatus]
MVKSTNNDKFSVMLLDADNYRRYLNGGSDWSCVSGTNSSCSVTLDGSHGNTFNDEFLVPSTQTYVTVVQCQNLVYPCTLILNFQISSIVALSNNGATIFLTCEYSAPSTKTTLKFPRLIFSCAAEAGWALQAPMIFSNNRGALYRVMIFGGSDGGDYAQGRSIKCQNGNSCASVLTSDTVYNTSFVFPVQGTYSFYVECLNYATTCDFHVDFRIVALAVTASLGLPTVLVFALLFLIL